MERAEGQVSFALCAPEVEAVLPSPNPHPDPHPHPKPNPHPKPKPKPNPKPKPKPKPNPNQAEEPDFHAVVFTQYDAMQRTLVAAIKAASRSGG